MCICKPHRKNVLEVLSTSQSESAEQIFIKKITSAHLGCFHLVNAGIYLPQEQGLNFPVAA